MTWWEIVLGYLAVGIIVRIFTKAGPEDDGDLWAVLLWPAILVLVVVYKIVLTGWRR